MTRRATTWLVLVALLAACASTSAGRLRQLRLAVGVYEETVIAIGSAAESGLLDEDQVAELTEAARLAESALGAARGSLAAYEAGIGGQPWSAVEGAVAAVAALLQGAVAAGVVEGSP